jgi:C-terminal processing protease CtpA/Prc
MKRIRFVAWTWGLPVGLLWGLAVIGVIAQSRPVNLGLEEGEIGQAPTGWFFPKPSQDAGYRVTLTEDRPHSGRRAAVLSRDGEVKPESFGNLMQAFDAAPYRGKRVRFRAAVRADVSGFGNRAQLWLRVDRRGEVMGFFDNMQDRPITANEWRTYEIVGDVAEDATYVNFGLMLIGQGRAWLDSVWFEIIGAAGEGNEPPRPLQGRARENLMAFTRRLGYVRYFHPSDQAAATQWEQLAIEGVRAVEGAKNPVELAQTLEGLVRPIAPTVRVFPTGQLPETPPMPPAAKKVVAWRHFGVGMGTPQSIYRSTRINSTEADGQDSKNMPDPEKPLVTELAGGVSCRVPLAVYADDQGTLPQVPSPTQTSSSPPGFVPSGNDRATRLADVALAWNIFQHFYPYFDVVGTDSMSVLRSALTKAATDQDERAFLDTLRWMVAELHDGHGSVSHQGYFGQFVPPFLWDWIEKQLVITHVAPGSGLSVKPGDVVLQVDGLPAADAMAERERLISGATLQWRRFQTLRTMLAGPKDSEITLEVQPQSKASYMVKVRRSVVFGEMREPRPPAVHEIKPGIFYLDLDRIKDAEFQAALPKLEKAGGIVFDLRGYPKVSPTTIGHLIDKPVTCAQWHIPIVFYPDRERMTFHFSNWPVTPAAPRFKAKVAFLTDGRAISYAETYLGIIEHYKLAEIVGEPTAGTNGNVNPFSLPGGYHVMWTGMKVLKHDGSRHHGVGIQPTVPVSPTIRGVAEGRDEQLERAIARFPPPRSQPPRRFIMAWASRG